MNILRFYSRSEWRIALILFGSYLLIYVMRDALVPAAAALHPAVVPAICALFFGGLRLWPIVTFSAIVGVLLVGGSTIALAIVPISVTLQAVVGAYLLRAARVDPIFRRFRDMFHLTLTVILISAISPTAACIVYVLRDAPFALETWGRFYLASLFVFIILLPFALRWLTKPRFARTQKETVETLLAFAMLFGILAMMILFKIDDLAGIPIAYFILMPLFWIALRMRPRFLTLALVLVAFVSVSNLIATTAPENLDSALFSAELFLVVIAAIFLTITSIEEDRRVNTNLLHSQLATLENAVARVKSESQAKNDFIAILAHELRNPLAPVVSAIDLLKVKGARDAEDAEALDMMADRMLVVRRLLDDLLDISRISEGKIMLKQEVVELEPVIQHAVLSTTHHRKELHQNFVFKSPDKPVYVEGDATRLEQVFSNILTNASKYSNSGDTITLSMRERAGFAEIEVIDQGLGLSAHEIERIFLPFQQVSHGERTAKGLGIGLSLVRSFVEMHGGTIHAESEGHGKGSRFTVRLPLHTGKTKRVPLGKQVESDRAREWHSVSPFAATENITVLIAIDDDADAGGIGRLLEREGCEVEYAYDGKQAIDKTLELRPDVALIDLDLPLIDGLTVVRTLHERGYTGRMIALVDYSTREVVEASTAAGFEAHIVKPPRLADLQRVIPEIA